MSKIKRTITFILAVITCMTFCLVNSSAVWYNYSGSYTEADINSGSAYGRVEITNWAQVVNDTDLKAMTYVYPYEYFDDAFISVRAYVRISITLEENSSYSTSDSATASSGTCTEALVAGDGLLNQDDHYGIIGFTSSHKVYVTNYTRYESSSMLWYDPMEVQDGDSVFIGTSS